MSMELFPGEKDIRVDNLLSVQTKENTRTGVTMYMSSANHWMTYDEIISNMAFIHPKSSTNS